MPPPMSCSWKRRHKRLSQLFITYLTDILFYLMMQKESCNLKTPTAIFWHKSQNDRFLKSVDDSILWVRIPMVSWNASISYFLSGTWGLLRKHECYIKMLSAKKSIVGTNRYTCFIDRVTQSEILCTVYTHLEIKTPAAIIFIETDLKFWHEAKSL